MLLMRLAVKEKAEGKEEVKKKDKSKPKKELFYTFRKLTFEEG